jgi:hypothetical protein
MDGIISFYLDPFSKALNLANSATYPAPLQKPD